MREVQFKREYHDLSAHSSRLATVMTLLQEIQADTSGSGGDLTTILRKCKILAARLGSEEFARWITWELDGYPDDQATPPYRRLAAQYYANFISVVWNAPASADLLACAWEESGRTDASG